MLVIAYLLSLPFYYFALTWQGGQPRFAAGELLCIGMGCGWICCLSLVGSYFSRRWIGDLYLWSSILVVMAIVLFFRGNGSYAVNLGRKLYPEGIRYKSMLSFEEGVGWEGICGSDEILICLHYYL